MTKRVAEPSKLKLMKVNGTSISDLNVSELRRELDLRSLKKTGVRKALQDRLYSSLILETLNDMKTRTLKAHLLQLILTEEGDDDKILNLHKEKSDEDVDKKVDLHIDQTESSSLRNSTIDQTIDPASHLNEIKDDMNKLEAKFRRQIDSLS